MERVQLIIVSQNSDFLKGFESITLGIDVSVPGSDEYKSLSRHQQS